MPLLAVDTALGACSVAVLEADQVLAHIFEPMDRGHAERLAPMVDEAMKMAGSDFNHIARLAVTTGPGTFTGQRVGLAFMRGLRLALQIPLVGVTTLEAIAAAACAQTGQDRVAVVHDARRNEAYLCLTEAERVVQPPILSTFADALAQIRSFRPGVLAGTGAVPIHANLGPGTALCTVCQPDALWVARLASSRPDPEAVPGPLYLRAPDAKRPGDKHLA